MTYGSICSGIEAAGVAWQPLGWRCAFLSEIAPFPRAVLKHRWHGVPLHGDFTTICEADYGAVDLLVGGTPCQSFSVAGLRGGLADARGNLALEYLRLAARLRPRWLVFENVPGVLSSSGGRDFGAFLGGLAECGYGWAYRVMDAQYFGVAQRRRRVFVVGHLGDWRRAAAVLFERHSLQGHPAPRREAREGTAYSVIKGAAIGRQPSAEPQYGEHLSDGSVYTLNCTEVHAVLPEVAGYLQERDAKGADSDTKPGHLLVTHSLRADGFDASEDGTGRGTPLVPVAVRTAPGTIAPPLKAQSGQSGKGDAAPLLAAGLAVRRLTPRECERLQGFPDDYTQVPLRNDNGAPNGRWAKDGPRYKALGNSMAVPVMRWIGERIAMVESAEKNPAAAIAIPAGRA